MVGADDLKSPEKTSRDSKGKTKVIADPIPSKAPPPAVPMPPGDDDLPSRNQKLPRSEKIRANGRYAKQTKQDDDIVMVDAGGPSERFSAPTLKRSDSSAKKAVLGGMFGGLLSKSRPDNKRRSTTLTDDEARGLRHDDRKTKRTSRSPVDADVTMTGGAAEEDQEARRAARRARRTEREAAEKAADDAREARDEERRERRRRQEEQLDARRQEDREAKRAARREQKAREDAARRADEAREAERAERRRIRRAEREGQNDGEPVTQDGRPIRSERRKSHMDVPADDDAERRKRREERRAARMSDAPKSSRRKSAPVVDSYFDPRNGSKARDAEAEFLPADGPVYKDSKPKNDVWPHSGTDSWVKDHSDAPPPPEDTAPADTGPVDDTIADENARRALRKTRHSKHEEEDREERKRRRESRRSDRDHHRSSEGSHDDSRRYSRRDSGFVETSRVRSSQGRGSWWKMIAGG